MAEGINNSLVNLAPSLSFQKDIFEEAAPFEPMMFILITDTIHVCQIYQEQLRSDEISTDTLR